VFPAFEERHFIVIVHWHIYLRVDRNNPVNIMIIPSTNPINRPIRMRLIKIPRINPSTMAKINAISPLLILGFFCIAFLNILCLKLKEAIS
jgi:hypothetical protein